MFSDQKRSSVIVLLQWSVYGLIYASKIWFELFKQKFVDAGMREMQSAPCTFLGHRSIALCYVNDLSMFSKPRDSIERLKRSLEYDQTMRDLGLPKASQGIGLSCKIGTVYLRRRRLIQDLLNENNYTPCKPMSNVMVTDQRVSHQDIDGPDESEARTY